MDWLELGLTFGLGFLGSLGHCVGMCGGLTLVFARLACSDRWDERLRFHLCLNLGRIASYGIVGAVLGGAGSLITKGREVVSVGLGLWLVGLGLVQVIPQSWSQQLNWHGLNLNFWHTKLSQAMANMAHRVSWWQTWVLGLLWGLIPCGFLYTAQIKAAESGSIEGGFLVMVAFGLGTIPAMVGSGFWFSYLNHDRRSQLYRFGGWITLVLGVITVARTDSLHDITGYGAFICLGLVMIARPIGRLVRLFLVYRRLLGVSAFALSLVHALVMLEHSLGWNLDGLSFMMLHYQWGVGAGVGAIALMVVPAMTSFDGAVRYLGGWWRRIHLLGVWAFFASGAHILLTGSHFLGAVVWDTPQLVNCIILGIVTTSAWLLRQKWLWQVWGQGKLYLPAGYDPEKLLQAKDDRS
jgi:sulfite exporter TauE/SafE